MLAFRRFLIGIIAPESKLQAKRVLTEFSFPIHRIKI